MEKRYHLEKIQSQNLEKQPGERAGHWAERLLISFINTLENARAEHATEDEDRYGVDIWVTIEGIEKAIPLDLTLAVEPKVIKTPEDTRKKVVIEEKRRKALKTGVAVFEVSQSGISLRELKLAALGADRYQKKVLNALNKAIEDWAEKLEKEGKSFITREEFAALIAADETHHRQQARYGKPKAPKGAKKRYKREKHARHAKRAS